MGLVLVDGYVELAEGIGNAPISASNGSCFRDRCSQLISACLPKLAARVGLAPTPRGLTDRRATLTLSGNGAAGRILTCIVPFRRRMPDIFDHDSKLKLVSAAGVAPAIPRSQAECVAATLRADAPSGFEERWSGDTRRRNPGNRPRGKT